jgi:hypothetical protein
MTAAAPSAIIFDYPFGARAVDVELDRATGPGRTRDANFVVPLKDTAGFSGVPSL